MRDNQKSKVYAWERSRFFYFPYITEKEALELVKKACKYFHVSNINVKFRKMNQTLGKGGSGAISLDPRRISKALVLHEVAHNIAGPPWHGGQFMSVYIKLLHHYKVTDKKALLRTAKKYNIEIKDVKRGTS